MRTEERPVKKLACVCKKNRAPREEQTASAPADRVCVVRMQLSLPRKASFLKRAGPGLHVEEGQMSENSEPSPPWR